MACLLSHSPVPFLSCRKGGEYSIGLLGPGHLHHFFYPPATCSRRLPVRLRPARIERGTRPLPTDRSGGAGLSSEHGEASGAPTLVRVVGDCAPGYRMQFWPCV